MNPETSREPSTSPAGAEQAAASNLKRRLTSVALKAIRKLRGRRFANADERRRAVYDELHGMLNESVCTRDEYYGGAEMIVGELVCELIPARGFARERANSSRTPRRSGRGKPTRTAQGAGGEAATGEDSPSGDVPPVGEDGPSPPARHLDVEALVAAAVERAVGPLRDENRRLRARIDELEAAPGATAAAVPSLPRHQVMGWTELTKAAQERGVRNDAGGTLTPAAVRNGVRRGFGRLAALQGHCVRGGVARDAACRVLAEIATLPAAPRVAPQDREVPPTRNRRTA